MYLHNRPCDQRRRAKLSARYVPPVAITWSLLCMRADIQRKRAAFVERQLSRRAFSPRKP